MIYDLRACYRKGQGPMTSVITGDGSVIRIAAADPGQAYAETAVDANGTVVGVGSTGVPGIEPLVMVTRDGRTAFHTECSPERFAAVLAETDGGTDVTAGNPVTVTDHDPEVAHLPGAQLAGLDTGTRRVLGGCGWRRPTNPDDHAAAGGFVDPDPETVLETGATLRGRGWGDCCHDDPVGETWRAVRGVDGETAVVVNAHGTPADTLLLASAPFEVLEGASALARTVDADRIVVYASSDDEQAVETVRSTVDSYPDPPTAIEVVTGPPAYRAAEPTMALEAIEGSERLEARLRPPGPETVGLNGQPTLVHTPRTLAHLAVALRDDEPPTTRALTVTGDVAGTTTVEVPESDPLSTALDVATVDGEFKAACVGGRFGGLTSDLDVTADPDTLADADLGTEGIVEILTADRCLVEFVGRRAQFAAETNCGRCVPCREGTTQLAELLRGLYDGDFDRDGIAELVDVMATSSICAFGVQAGRPTRTALAAFRAEFEAHAEGDCPAGNCLEPLETA